MKFVIFQIDRIKSLPHDEIDAACYLFRAMIYPDGEREGKIFSLYLVNKAKEFIIGGLYKQNASVSARCWQSYGRLLYIYQHRKDAFIH